MVQVRVPIVTGAGGVQAQAPVFVEIPGSYQGDATVLTPGGVMPGIALGNPKLAGATVLVDVPVEDTSNGQLDGAKIAARYPNHFLVKNGTFK